MAFYSGLSGIVKGIGNFLTGTVSVVGTLFGDILGRLFGIVGFFLDLIGIRFKKKLRLKYFILLDERGTPLVPQESVVENFNITKRIFDEQADIEIIQAGILEVGGAPAGALDVAGPVEGFFENWSAVGTYFNMLAGIGPFTRELSVIIVRTLGWDHTGRAQSFIFPAANFVMVTKARIHSANPDTGEILVPPATATTAHEIGHACGLIHRKPKENLMHDIPGGNSPVPWERGEKLSFGQSLWARGSKFVWYF